MRLSVTTAALVLLLTVAAPARVFDSAKLKPKGLGPLKIGMTEKEVEKVIGRNVRQDKLGGPCGTARLDARNYLLFTNDVLRRVSINSRNYAMKGSKLRIGDRQSAIRKAYGRKAKRTRHVYLEKGYYFEVKARGRKRIRFETDGRRITAMHGGREPEVGYVEACA